MTERERIEAVLKREKPDVVPWATRLDIWYGSLTKTGTLPEEYKNMEIMKIYEDMNIGRQSYVHIALSKLHGVDVTAEFNGKVIFSENAPVLRFPLVTSLVPRSEPGITVFTFKSPVGTITMHYKTNQELIDGYANPYMMKHLVENDDDYNVLGWILDHSEIVADYDAFHTREAEIGDNGFSIGFLERPPFQRMLLDFLGEVYTFYQMFDNPQQFNKLLDQLGALNKEYIRVGKEFPGLMLECPDNIDGNITNPNFFTQYIVPVYQEMADAFHGAGKVLGSHMDGDLKHLLDLIPDCGIDVVESFSPYPLSNVTVDQILEKNQGKTVLWGCISSPFFEPEFTEEAFLEEASHIVDLAKTEGCIILGVADQAVKRTSRDRIRKVRELIENK